MYATDGPTDRRMDGQKERLLPPSSSKFPYPILISLSMETDNELPMASRSLLQWRHVRAQLSCTSIVL